MRDSFYRAISELAKNDKEVYLICPDFSLPYNFPMKKDNPSQIIQTGLSEQASIGIASGLALSGFKPYMIAITPFLIERGFEQIKLDIVQQKANVKLVGYWDYPSAGLTHKTQDVKGLCDIAGIKLYTPKSAQEAYNSLIEESKSNTPAFFYLTREGAKNDIK
jgi:transketolase